MACYNLGMAAWLFPAPKITVSTDGGTISGALVAMSQDGGPPRVFLNSTYIPTSVLQAFEPALIYIAFRCDCPVTSPPWLQADHRIVKIAVEFPDGVQFVCHGELCHLSFSPNWIRLGVVPAAPPEPPPGPAMSIADLMRTLGWDGASEKPLRFNQEGGFSEN